MFTPCNRIKLTNISIITLKKYNTTYSIPVYPNKLYEYQCGITPLNEIVVSTDIYKNVSKGIKCSKQDLCHFNKPIHEIIQEIVHSGYEQKNLVTRQYEHEMVLNQICEQVRRKVLRNDKFVSQTQIKQDINKVYTVRIDDIKPQVLDIISILVHNGYTRIRMKIQVDSTKLVHYDGDIEVEDEYVYTSTTEFIRLRKYCNEKNIKFIVKKNLEENEEEIC